ncbi:uncharacterized protein LOC124368550 [Homalodisca vitripennis]|uniref:uncharacterized protein LOC124368550 n=1 Tax=Homalodisca vitripennis TaxID=197043 RepID=UPI001EEC9429|nr:uncharacterized protein LOC124368550 [Homalodisca vitripennis]
MGIPPGLVLVVLSILFAVPLIHSIEGGTGRRGHVLNTGDVGSQVLFNVDNSGRGSGDGGDRGSLPCEMIMRECNCKVPPGSEKFEGDFGPVTVKWTRPPRRKPEYIFY